MAQGSSGYLGAAARQKKIDEFNQQQMSQQKSSGKYNAAYLGGQAVGSVVNQMASIRSPEQLPQEQITPQQPRTMTERITGAATQGLKNVAAKVTAPAKQTIDQVLSTLEAREVAGQQQQQATSLDENTIFEMLKSGELQARPDNQGWNSMYQNGTATTEQKRAWARWMNLNQYTNMNADQLYNALNSGKLSINSPVWNDLTINGQMTPQQQAAYDTYQADRSVNDINAHMTFTGELISGAQLKADEYRIAQLSTEARVSDLEQAIAGVMSTPLPSALNLYQKYIAQNPKLNELNSQAIELNKEIKKIDVETLYLRDEITDLVDGEAHQGYIDALASQKASELYKKKSMLLLEMDTVTSQLQYEQNISEKMIEFETQDSQTKYNQMLQLMNFGLDMAKFQNQMSREGLQDQLSIANFNMDVADFNSDQAQQLLDNQMKVAQWKQNIINDNKAEAQQMVENEMKLQEFLFDIPEGQIVTLSSGVYVGMGSDRDVSVNQLIEPDGDTWVIGYDKNTGEEIYRTLIGSTTPKYAGQTGQDDPLNQLIYKQTLSDIQDIQGGELIQIGDKVYDSEEYRAYESAEGLNDLFKEQVKNYYDSYKSWLALPNIAKNAMAGKWDKIDFSTAPEPPIMPPELASYYTIKSDAGTARTLIEQIKPITKPSGRTYKQPQA
jgi:hypothetical protein